MFFATQNLSYKANYKTHFFPHSERRHNDQPLLAFG